MIRYYRTIDVSRRVFDLDTQDEEELVELQELVTDCEENYQEIY